MLPADQLPCAHAANCSASEPNPAATSASAHLRRQGRAVRSTAQHVSCAHAAKCWALEHNPGGSSPAAHLHSRAVCSTAKQLSRAVAANLVMCCRNQPSCKLCFSTSAQAHQSSAARVAQHSREVPLGNQGIAKPSRARTTVEQNSRSTTAGQDVAHHRSSEHSKRQCQHRASHTYGAAHLNGAYIRDTTLFPTLQHEESKAGERTCRKAEGRQKQRS